MTLKAIDLYSGVGGWSLGLRLAGIEVVASYERWGPANETNFKNNAHQAQTVDIRRLSFDDLPKGIHIVVGSPPCTQFSFSNRGGSGNLDDGLEDIIKFLSIVDHLRPAAWAMENVPRVAPIIKKELLPGGRLHKFVHLGVNPHVVNMEDFGVPQRRRRCVAGNFDFALLESYAEKTPRRTLGAVVKALAADPVVDPLYGLSMPADALVDHHPEAHLNIEEVRINRAAKAIHPVYNAMPFPDRLDRSVRTITATCTRVSRESIVIEDPSIAGAYRRLTIRERACLQGFPTTFQFYGANYGQKLRMVGNAVPPAFAFLVAQTFLGTKPEDLPSLPEVSSNLSAPSPLPATTEPDRPGATYPRNRKFRFAITSLRLKSGVRFELINAFAGDEVSWRVAFWFGTSKSIQALTLDADTNRYVLGQLPPELTDALTEPLQRLTQYVRNADVANMQTVWAHHGVSETRPFMLLDELGEIGEIVQAILAGDEEASQRILADAVEREYKERTTGLPGVAKLLRNAPLILAGLIVGSVANVELTRHVNGAASGDAQSAKRQRATR